MSQSEWIAYRRAKKKNIRLLLHDKFPFWLLLNGCFAQPTDQLPELICIPKPSPEVLCAVQLKAQFCLFLRAAELN